MSILQGITLASTVLWLLYEVQLAWRQNSRRTGAQRQDRGSYIVAFASYIAGLGAAFSLPFFLDLGQFSPLWQIIGLLTFWMGFSIRHWAVKTLGKFFTVDVSIHEEHRLIQEGPYRDMRHPSYTGLMSIILGLGLGLGYISSFVALMLISGPGLLWRIHVEEAALQSAFGDDYTAYCKRTKRLIPGVF